MKVGSALLFLASTGLASVSVGRGILLDSRNSDQQDHPKAVNVPSLDSEISPEPTTESPTFKSPNSGKWWDDGVSDSKNAQVKSVRAGSQAL